MNRYSRDHDNGFHSYSQHKHKRIYIQPQPLIPQPTPEHQNTRQTPLRQHGGVLITDSIGPTSEAQEEVMLAQLTCVETSQEYREEQCRNRNRTDDPN